MKRCFHCSRLLPAFSLGLLMGVLLPKTWLAVAAVVLLTVVCFATQRAFYY